MADVLHEFTIWCVQFVFVSTVFLTTSYWLLGRSRKQKARSATAPASIELKLQEAGHVAHGS